MIPRDSSGRRDAGTERPVHASKRTLLGALLAVLALPLARLGVAAAKPGRTGAADKGRMHLFLLAGQSNMAGRGDVEPADREPIEGVLALNAAGDWVPAIDPLHWDKPSAGAGLARSFAQRYLRAHPGVSVGFIPAACGGSPIAAWQPGKYFEETNSHPYDDAIARTRHALERGTLKAILWHQGESDRAPERAPKHQQALTALIERFRRDLAAPRLPFVIGQLGQFAGGGAWDEPTRRIDRAQRDVARKLPFCAFVPSDGLTSKPDNLHFDARSLREFGQRYATALATLEARGT